MNKRNEGEMPSEEKADAATEQEVSSSEAHSAKTFYEKASSRAASSIDNLPETREEEQLGTQVSATYIYHNTWIDSVSGAVHSGQGDVRWGAATSSTTLEIAMGVVSKEEINKVHQVYVDSKLSQKAYQQLREQRLVILWGEAKKGKATTAIYLLSKINYEEIFEISPNLDLEELRFERDQSERAYLINTIAPQIGEQMKPFHLKQLQRILHKQRSHLVITVDQRVPLVQDEINNYLVHWEQAIPSDEILINHIKWHAGEKYLTKATELANSEDVQQTLTGFLLPRDYDQLGYLLNQVAREALTLQEALARFRAGASKQVESWFLENTDLSDRILMITLAVFSGAHYQSVIEAADALRAYLVSPSAPDETSVQPPNPFQEPRTQRLRRVCASLGQGYKITEIGRIPIETVQLDNPSFQPAVLAYIWYEHDGLRDAILEWLSDYGKHLSVEMRVRAAGAIGELSKYDFTYILNRVIRPWANHPDSRVRAATVWALGIPIWEEELAPQVLTLLHHWSTLSSNWRLNCTAALTYGRLVGQRYPEIALQNLWLIAQHFPYTGKWLENIELLEIIQWSVLSLFETGKKFPTHYTKVLDALVLWTNHTKDSPASFIGLLLFNTLAKSLRETEIESGIAWPTLLWLASEDSTSQQGVALLWERILRNHWLRKEALQTLHQWLQYGQEDARLLTHLEKLVLTLGSGGSVRDVDRLTFYLKRWSESGPTSQIANHLLRYLQNIQE